MSEYIKVLKEIFSPKEIYESKSMITLVIENDNEKIEDKIKLIPQIAQINKTIRIITTNEIECHKFDDLGVKIY